MRNCALGTTTEVSVQWAGNYTCVVQNAGGADAVTHAVTVLPPPPRPPTPRLLRASAHALYVAWHPAPLPQDLLLGTSPREAF